MSGSGRHPVDATPAADRVGGTSIPNRWAVLAGAWSVYAAFGLLVATTGALVPQIRADLGLSDGRMGLVLGAWQLVFIGASIPAGWIIDRFGVRRALLVSMTVMLASGYGRAVATGLPTLFAAVALHGAGAPMISVGAPTVAAGLFEGRDRRLAVGIYSTAPAIGSVAGLVLPNGVVGPLVDGDWRAIVVILTSVAALALVVWAVVSRGLEGVLRPGAGPAIGEYRDIARLPVVRFVLVLSVATFFFVHGIGQWAVAILTESGWSAGQAGSWAGLGTAGGLVATFGLPRVATPELRPVLLIGTLIVGAVAVQFLTATGAAVLAPAIVVAFVARTALLPLLVMTLMDHRSVGPTRTAAATGLFFTTAQIGGVGGPAVTGALSEATGGFRFPLAVHSVVMVAIAVAIAAGYRRSLA